MTRLVLATLLSMVVLGCSSDDGDEPASGSGGSGGDAGTSGASASGGAGASGGTGGTGGTGATGERPYANVVAVAVTGDSGAYSFAVSVESADIDCTQYADWWEVVTDGGALVYRRILEHSHTDENGTTDTDAPGNTFTRSGGPVDVSPDDLLVVRAHMSNEGYNGVAFSGTAADGFVEATDIDSDFAPDVASEEPLPTECQF